MMATIPRTEMLLHSFSNAFTAAAAKNMGILSSTLILQGFSEEMRRQILLLTQFHIVFITIIIIIIIIVIVVVVVILFI